MLKNKKYDLIIDFRNSLLPYFLKAEYRMTFFLKEFFSKKFTTHESERVIKFLEPYFGINENHGLYFPVKEEEIEESRKIFEKFGVSDADDFIVLNPGAAFEKKRWNKNRFAALGREIMNKYNVTLIIVGNKDDFKVAEEIVSKINCKRVLNLAGQISFRHLACLLLRALLLITNDTGTMHLASAIRCPVVAIFGPGNPMRYGPIGTKSIVVHTERTCFPCKLESRCKKNFICMEDVSVEQVLSAVSRILD